MYTLRFPFTLREGHEFTENEDVTLDLGGKTGTFSPGGHHVELRITGFESKDAAERFIGSVWTAFMQAMIKEDVPVAVQTLEPGNITYAEDPRAAAENLSEAFGGVEFEEDVIHGIADGNRPAIYRSDQQIRKFVAGSAQLTLGADLAEFGAAFADALADENRNALGDETLSLGFELYSASFEARTSRTTFLTLMIILDVLANEEEKHADVQAMMDRWEAELNDEIETDGLPDRKRNDLEALRRELSFRRGQSLRSAIYDLVEEAYHQRGRSDMAEQKANRAKTLYDKRSRLVHEGRLGGEEEIGALIQQAREICGQVLQARLAG